MNTNLNIRTDKEIKEKSEKIFSELGISMTTAINMFLRQTIRFGGIPFELKVTPNAETISAINEMEDIISGRKETKSYTDLNELFEDLDS